jgi:preprotein translocase subunit YajC
MLTNLMAASATSWIFMGILILAFVGMYYMSYQKRKKEAQKAKERMDSLVEGTVIKTI